MPHDSGDQPVETGFENVRLFPGAEMQVQSLTDMAQERHKVRFIGFIKDKSLLVTLPFRNGERMWMEDGQAFIVRGFDGRYAYAFTTHVIRARAHPFPYLHFAWPHQVECRQVRNSLRVAVSLSASVTFADGASAAATILDMSVSGALLDLPVETVSAGDGIRVGFTVDPGDNAMGMNISAKIRKVYRKGNGTGSRIGVEFEDVSHSDALALHYFVNTANGRE